MRTKIVENAERWKWNVVIGIPSLGQVRIEWCMAYSSMVIPMNFSMAKLLHPVLTITPLRYHVAEAQNMILREVFNADGHWDWVLFLEDDVVPPPNILLRLAKWIRQDRYPMVSGLYHLKSEPPEPMTFRGRGNGSWDGWQNGKSDVISKRATLPDGVKPKEVAFCDGVPTGCLLMSTKLLRVAWNESPEILLTRKLADGTVVQCKTREVFVTRREAGIDPETGGYYMRAGTSDLEFCDRAIKEGWMQKAGYKEAARMKYPFPVDLAIHCGHIELSTGRVY